MEFIKHSASDIPNRQTLDRYKADIRQASKQISKQTSRQISRQTDISKILQIEYCSPQIYRIVKLIGKNPGPLIRILRKEAKSLFSNFRS